MFKNRLKHEIENFNLESAQCLSMQIHAEELKGHEITEEEDSLWFDLTIMIQKELENKKRKK